MPSLQEISPTQLSRLIGTPEAPVLLDLRVDEDYAADPRMVPGSVRQDYRAAIGIAPGTRVVTICHRGRKISQGVAAQLRAEGVAAEVLEGGFVAWAEAGLLTVTDVPAPRSLWVTRQRPKIDRIACPWLIRRFIDREARFLFVPSQDVTEVAARFGAEAFDVEGVRYSHRGEACTFDTLLEEFGLRSNALDRLALVVRAADTDRHDLAPQAAGLLALSVGLSRLYSDDIAQLEAGMGMYDALYRWARDGFEEGHDWPAGRPQ
ncbi:sulfurtransferase [Silicimonas algicola]|uniref:Rhodanese domain-containing protein n=1 Tax=Silicimonas algicola TaxID=1826607 RepID=A0A316G696_9RHOB|nr:sulfurtransferase/chromate resistance protein [Silicimonas algicola]AZQ69361.1 sulfurtransferase [Silicimonas algicola]PWK56424.1 hypothetical protein C8D95_10495 [Silicimonas algicola]